MSSSLELDASTAPGVGADAGSHDAASVTGRQQDVQYESLKWNTLPHATHRLCEGVSRSVASSGVFAGGASCPDARSRRGLGGTDVEDEGTVSGPRGRGIDEANAGLLWGWVSAEGIAGVSLARASKCGRDASPSLFPSLDEASIPKSLVLYSFFSSALETIAIL